MYVPEMYAEESCQESLDLVRSNPLALFVTTPRNGVPVAAHLPVVAESDSDGALAGRFLVGHINRKNPQWAALRSGDRALVVFHGPHGYLSPAVCGVTPAAPTWNFTAVHVTGSITLVDQPAEVLAVITRTVSQLEGRFGIGWDMASSLSYFDQLLPYVAAFRLHVESVQSVFKLSQEQQPDKQEQVIQWFESSEHGQHHQVARLMRDRSMGLSEAPAWR